MKIVIAPDSFKESLTALEVAESIEEGFKKVFPDANYIKVPMADGGEGTVQSLIDATQGKLIKTSVTAPLGNRVDSFFGLSGDKKTAIIEMAAASGLHLVPHNKRNPLITTSFGTGELIKAALDCGVNKVILGIGGSATNDGGAGMLQSLGVKLLDKNNQELASGGASLAQLHTIDMTHIDPRLKKLDIEVACDVDNPLCGKNGASYVFGPQKGASLADVEQLDHALMNFSAVIKRQLNVDVVNVPGAGAAGGMGAGLLAFLNAHLKPGVQIVIEHVKLADIIKDADLVITGEGRIDAQSVQGKTPIGVARLAKKYHRPVIAISGCIREDYEVVYNHGIDAVFPIIRQLASLEEIMNDGKNNLISTAQNVARLYALGNR